MIFMVRQLDDLEVGDLRSSLWYQDGELEPKAQSIYSGCLHWIRSLFGPLPILDGNYLRGDRELKRTLLVPNYILLRARKKSCHK